MRKLGSAYRSASRVVVPLLNNAFYLALILGSLMLALLGLNRVLEGGGGAAWFVLVFFSICALVISHDLLLRRGLLRHPWRLFRRRPHRVCLTEEGIVSHHPNGTVERVAWNRLEAVALRAEDAYPVGDVYWFLIGADDTGCVFPIGAEGCDAVLEAFQSRLPGFDNEALIEAMGLLEGGRVVWRRGDHSPES